MTSRSPNPPKQATRLLSRFLREDLAEEVLGDLEEKFYRTLNEKSLWRAQLSYWYQTINYLRPFALRKSKTRSSNRIAMVRFNLVLTMRNMMRNGFYTSLNLVGLSIGIGCTILISLYILDELSYDQHWPDKDRIYRAYNTIDYGETHSSVGLASAPMAEIFEREFPEVEYTARWIGSPPMTFRVGDKLIKETRIILADQKLIPMLSLKVLYGDGENALTQPNTMILTRSGAIKYFGIEDVVGNELPNNAGRTFHITAVIEDIPRNSHLAADVIYTTINDRWSDPTKVNFLTYWTLSGYFTYLKLTPGSDPRALEEKFKGMYPTYFDKVARAFSGQSWEEFLAEGNNYSYSLQPLEDIYLGSGHFNNNGPIHGESEYIYMFGVIAIFILCIAYVNFINLSTARAAIRSKEIGIKKILGSSRSQLIKQFLTESLIFSLLGFVIGAALTYLILPVFNNITGKEFSNPIFNRHHFWFWGLVGTVLSAIVAGCYPAFVLSGHKPIHLFKTGGDGQKSGSVFRNVLVVLQFTISIILVIGTLVVYQQLDFVQKQNLGYNRDNVLLITDIRGIGPHFEGFRELLLADPEVVNVSGINNVPSDQYFSFPFFHKADNDAREGRFTTKRLWVDEHMISTLGIELIEGRNFRNNQNVDSLSIIVNQSAVKKFGLYPPIGQKLKNTDGQNRTFTVIGVVKDFHLQSLKSSLGPVAINWTSTPRRMVIRYNTSDLPDFLNRLEETWKTFSPNDVLSYQFLDDRYDRFYKSERRTGSLFRIFVFVALIIASLGLFGLTSLMTTQRKKEIGIRKVLGASVRQLVLLLNGSLTKPILISLVIGIPIGFLFMEEWLSDFSYRITIQWITLLSAGLISLGVSWLVISTLTVRTAKSNPTDNLRYE